MSKIYFSTTNERKLREARDGCGLLGIGIEPIALDFEEIQSHDPINITKHKVSRAYELSGKDHVVVTDTSWNIPSLNGFPGGYMKDVAEWFSADDFINLVKDKQDKTIIFRETIAYKDSTEVKVFSRDYKGVIVDSKQSLNGNSIEVVAEFDGRTLAQSRDLNSTSHNPEEYVWYEFAKWYKENKA